VRYLIGGQDAVFHALHRSARPSVVRAGKHEHRAEERIVPGLLRLARAAGLSGIVMAEFQVGQKVTVGGYMDKPVSRPGQRLEGFLGGVAPLIEDAGNAALFPQAAQFFVPGQ
jgi:hypothetical protein